MYIRVDDGNVIFATHLIRCTYKGAKELAPFQLEPEGIVIYPGDNTTDAENILTELNIPYTVEALTHDPLHKTKCQGVKYCSRSEAIEHLLHDTEPESQVLPNLQKKLADEKMRNDNLEKKLAQMEARLLKGGL